jgi:hypothetical protein
MASRPAIELTFTMAPLRRSRIPGSTAWIIRMAPKQFVSKRSFAQSTGTSASGPPPPMPALLTRTSTRPE